MATDWATIKTEYITTETSYRKLAKKYGVSQTQICNVGVKEGWVEERERFLNKTVTKAINAIGAEQARRAARLQGVADKLLGKIETLLEEHEELLVDTQAMRHISATLKDIRDIQFIRSESDMKEQAARIKKLEKEAEKDEAKSNDVTIRIVGGTEEWQE